MSRIGYVLKVYPRFSETFIVTELLAREAQGEDIAIFALRPTTDARFHPEIARVQAPVTWVPRPLKPSELWKQLTTTVVDNNLSHRFADIWPLVADLPGDEVAQGVSLAVQAQQAGITHLHAHFASLAGRSAWIASQLTGIPYTVTTHAKDIFHASVDHDWLRRVCGDAQRVIAISAFNRDYLTSVLAGSDAQISLQYNALELNRFPFLPPQPNTPESCPATQGRPLRVLAVGRLVPKKGFADLITATRSLVDRGVTVEVTIAGDGELRDTLQRQITDLGLDEVVAMVGPKTQQEVRDLLNSADVSVTPCIPASDGNIDGLPTVILEAMACGTPVVATAVSGLPEVVINDHTGVLTQPGEPGELARVLDDIAHGYIPTHTLAHNARTLINERFDSTLQAAQLHLWQNPKGDN